MEEDHASSYSLIERIITWIKSGIEKATSYYKHFWEAAHSIFCKLLDFLKKRVRFIFKVKVHQDSSHAGNQGGKFEVRVFKYGVLIKWNVMFPVFISWLVERFLGT